jgi:hypothetical protein
MPEWPGVEPIPIDALFASDGISPNPELDAAKMLSEAQVIIGRDVMTGHEFLLFGRDRLARIARTGVEQAAVVLKIELDQETDELEKLIALVEFIKGKHDYPGGMIRE